MAWLAVMFGSVALTILVAQILSYGTRTGLRLVRLATRLLPAVQRDRYREEWTRNVEDRSDGDQHHFAAMLWGLGTLPAAAVRSQVNRRFPAWLLADGGLRLSVGVLAGLSVGLGDGVVPGVGAGLAFGLLLALTDRRGIGLSRTAAADRIRALSNLELLELISSAKTPPPKGLGKGGTGGLVYWLTTEGHVYVKGLIVCGVLQDPDKEPRGRHKVNGGSHATG